MGSALYAGDKKVEEINLTSDEGKFGAVFTFDGVGETVLSISFLSEQHALSLLERDGEKSFDEVRKEGYEIWNRMLSRIDVEGSDEERKLFYSNLYFSLVKPADVSGEKLYGFDGDAVTDLATLWDMYKTEFPLLFTCYPEIGNKVIQTMISFYDKNGFLPNSYLISPTQSLEAGQAMFLTSYVFADAALRGIGDVKEMYRVLRAEYLSGAFDTFRKNGREKRTTHTMDIYEGLICLAILAEKATPAPAVEPVLDEPEAAEAAPVPEVEEKPTTAEEPQSVPVVEAEPIAEPEPEPVVEPEPVAEPEPIAEPEPVVEPEPAVGADIKETVVEKPLPVDPETPRKRPAWKVWLWIGLGLIGLLVLALVVFVILAHVAPDFIDSLLYSPEELEILHYPE